LRAQWENEVSKVREGDKGEERDDTINTSNKGFKRGRSRRRGRATVLRER
jgi:hypothetical protein